MKVINHPNAHLITGIEALAKNMLPLAEKRIVEEKFEDVAYYVPFYLKDFVAKEAKPLLWVIQLVFINQKLVWIVNGK